MFWIKYYKSGSDNPPNATSNITKVCTVCGGEYPTAEEYFTKFKGGQYGLGQNVSMENM